MELIRCADSDVMLLFRAEVEEAPDGADRTFHVDTTAFQLYHN